MDEIRLEIRELNRNVTSVITLLKGSEFDSDTGMIATMKAQEKEIELLNKRVDKLEKWRDRGIAAALGMALPSGYGIFEIIKQFI